MQTKQLASEYSVICRLAGENSSGGGQHWDLDNLVRLWDATGWTHLGIRSPDKYPHSHDTIAFGAPTLTAIQEGDLYVSWWCTYASITHIRWARLRVGE